MRQQGTGRSVDVMNRTRSKARDTNMPDRKGDPMQNPPDIPGPATHIPLFRSARYSLYTSGPEKSGTDIYVRIKRDGTLRYFIRDWSEEQDTCMSVEFENIRRVLPGYVIKGRRR